jgi:hypothetical protein
MIKYTFEKFVKFPHVNGITFVTTTFDNWMNKGVLVNYMLNLFEKYKSTDKLFYVKVKEQISTLKWF